MKNNIIDLAQIIQQQPDDYIKTNPEKDAKYMNLLAKLNNLKGNTQIDEK